MDRLPVLPRVTGSLFLLADILVLLAIARVGKALLAVTTDKGASVLWRVRMWRRSLAAVREYLLAARAADMFQVVL